jgi:hypothetical protein
MLIRKIFVRIPIYLLVFFLGIFILLVNDVVAEDVQKYTEMVHWVSPGESLHKIARRYLPLTAELTVSDLIEKIKALSGVEGSLIRPNQRLLIPLVRPTPVAAKTIPKRIDFEAKGIYLNRYSMASKKIRRLVDDLIASGGNTVILDGKDMSGMLSYPSRVNLANEIGATASPVTRDLGKLIHYLHTRGIHVGVRLVLFYDELLATAKPGLALRDITTGEPLIENGKIAWVDPGQPAVQEYNLLIAKELAEMGIDEVQFDYIRFPTKENVEYTKLSLDEQMTPRHKIITHFLAQARKALAPHKVLLSIDVFGIIAWGRSEDTQITGQKIEDLARYSDVISPMIYPSHFDNPFQGIVNPNAHPYLMVSETCRRFSESLADSKVTLRPWIQAFPLGAGNFDEDYILQQLHALDESRASGWLLWSAGNSYHVAWQALAQWSDMDFKVKNISADPFLDDLTSEKFNGSNENRFGGFSKGVGASKEKVESAWIAPYSEVTEEENPYSFGVFD